MRGNRFFRVQGKKLWNELFKRDYEKGALSMLVLAPKGSGKTTLMATVALASLRLGDIVLWRGRSRDYWPRFPPEITHVLIHENIKLHVVRQKPGERYGKDITDRYNIETYSTMEDLYEKIKPRTINVIYEPHYHKPSQKLAEQIGWDNWVEGIFWWYDFISMLAQRVDARFMTLVFDEIHDIFPAGSSGYRWAAIQYMERPLSETREKLIYLWGATHDYTHIDPRILQKFDGFIYLRGARASPKVSMMRDKNAPMHIKDLGYGIIELRGRGYGGFEFDDLPRDGYLYSVISKWSGPVPKTRKMTIKDEIMLIAEEEGAEAAFKVLKEKYVEGEISQGYFSILRRELEKKYGLVVPKKI